MQIGQSDALIPPPIANTINQTEPMKLCNKLNGSAQ